MFSAGDSTLIGLGGPVIRGHFTGALRRVVARANDNYNPSRRSRRYTLVLSLVIALQFVGFDPKEETTDQTVVENSRLLFEDASRRFGAGTSRPTCSRA